VVVLSLLAIVMMSLDHRQQHMESVRSVLSVVLYPIQYLIGVPRETGLWLSESLATRHTLREENERLHARQLLLQSRLQRLEALEAENNRLRELLDSSFKVEGRVLIAELLSVDMAPFTRRLTLNKGSYDEVYRGQPVLDAAGVLGQVVAVSPITSTAMLITDPSHALPVAVNRNGLRAIAIGTGEPNRLELSHIPNNADIKIGDLLITSGLGGRFPEGYPVARIIHIERNPDRPFARVYAEPTGNLESSREVLLIWNAEPQAPQQPAAPAGREAGP